MLVLAVDTSTPDGSVALVRDGRVQAELRFAGETLHSTRVLPRIEWMLSELRLEPQQLEAFAVISGPGSFTGLRIGLGTVQGMALGLGRPCLAVSALDVMAFRARGLGSDLVAVRNAWQGELFVNFYTGLGQPRGEIEILSPEQLCSRLPERAVLLGEGVEATFADFLAHRPDLSRAPLGPFLAGALGRLAEPRLAAGEGVPASQLRPLYVRGPGIAVPSRT